MELLQLLIELIRFVGAHFIKGIFVSVGLVLLTNIFFGEKIKTALALQFLRWTIVLYSWLLLLSILSFWITGNIDWNTYSGSLHWILLFLNAVLPLLLLSEKLGKKGILVFVLSLLMNIGWLFESYVVHTTHLHRDYIAPESNLWTTYASEWTILGKGILLGLVAIAAGWFIEKRTIRVK